MKRTKSYLVGLLGGAASLMFVSVALAASGHFLTSGANAPSCVDLGVTVQCSGKVAGLGGTTFEIRVAAPGTAIVECRNPGGNIAPGQDTAINAAGTSGPLPTPRNGQYVFTVTTDPPVVPNFPTCPNTQWTANVVDVVFGIATLSLFEDDVLVDSVQVIVR
jgi:hypothetical protein